MVGRRTGSQVDGRYVIVDKLGEGSMGVVYRAEDIGLGRVVALKFADGLVGADERAQRGFLEEARAIARVRHENVVQIHSYGVDDTVPYFAMEHIGGECLDGIIEKEAELGTTVDVDRALSIITAVARGLDAVHEIGVVHRDVKPSNVMIENGTGRPVLVDFGVARRKASSAPRLTTAGTPMYMAPEQARDIDGTQVTPAADLYGLACTSFELLTGQPVFDGPDIYAVLIAHLNATPPVISSLRPDLEPFDPIFARALAKTPDNRHESCGAFAKELNDAWKVTSATSRKRAKRRVVKEGAPRVYLLEADEAFVQKLVRTADRALDHPTVECFTAAAELVAAFEREAAALVVLDEESSASPATTIVNAIRRCPGGAEARIVVLSRSWEGAPSGLEHLGVKELPKPVNLSVLASVMARVSRSS